MKKTVEALVVVAALLLIGGQALLGSLPPWLFYPLFAVLAGGAIGLKGHKFWQDYQDAKVAGPEEAKQHLLITGGILLFVAVFAFFFFRS